MTATAAQRHDRRPHAQPDALDLLGMDRMIRRAYEVATSGAPEVTKAWHEAEVRAAAKRRRLE